MSNPKLHWNPVFAGGSRDSNIREAACSDGKRMLESEPLEKTLFPRHEFNRNSPGIG
jgi:hypothetical protein